MAQKHSEISLVLIRIKLKKLCIYELCCTALLVASLQL